MVKPSVEHLHPFFPGGFSGFNDNHFYPSQLAKWKCSRTLARNFVQVNRLWWGIAERFLYSAFYLEEEWRAQKFIDTIKLNPNLAKQLRTLIIIPSLLSRAIKGAYFDPLLAQMLSLCHNIDAIVLDSDLPSSPLPLFHSIDSSRRLLFFSAFYLQGEEFATFMINFNNYANLQVLELSVYSVNARTLRTLPEHITFPSLHTLILGYLYPFVTNTVGAWELPSLKELSISRWDPPSSTALLPLIQRSYDRLEIFDACVDMLHDCDFHNIIRTPPLHLKNLTLNFAKSESSWPPTYPAIKTLLHHVVTLGMSRFDMVMIGLEPHWFNFFSYPTYTPHLRSLLTDLAPNGLVLSSKVRNDFLEDFCVFQMELERRGVAVKGVTNDELSFIPLNLLPSDTDEVSMFCLVMDRCSYPHQHRNACFRCNNPPLSRADFEHYGVL